jgi:virginiamycin B lyase
VSHSTKGKSFILVSVLILLIIVSGGVVYAGFYSSTNSKSTLTTIPKTSIDNDSPISDQFVKEFTLPDGLPNAIAVDSDGWVWTVLQNSSSLAVLFPSNGSVVEFPIPGLNSKTPLTTWGIAIDQKRQSLWFTEEMSNAVWSFDMRTQTFKEYSIPTLESNPYQVAVDSSGNAWFTEFTGDKIGVVSLNGTIHEFQIPIQSSNPTGIAIDPKTNRVWFNLLDTAGSFDQFYVGSLLNGSFTFNDITSLVDTPVGIAVDSSGNLWLTQHGASLVSEFNPITHYFRTISTSIPPVGASYPYFVYVDNSTGKIWFNEHYGNAISVFDPKSDSLIEYEIPSRNSGNGNISGALTMTLAKDGTPWFTELYTGKVGEVNYSAPVETSLSVSTKQIMLVNESTSSIQLSIRAPANETTNLSASVGNFTGNLLFNFTSFSGQGTFSTNMSIQNGGSPPGVYFVTISAESGDVIVSKVIEIKC